MKTQSGLIGFFDVLGYQDILKNNSAEIAAESVLPILTGLKQTIPKIINKNIHDNIKDDAFSTKEFSPGEIKKGFSTMIDAVDWLIFSDTILLRMPVKTIKEASLEIQIFFTVCTHMLKAMFDAGLPLRGAIDFGDYCVQKNCFTGQPIVDSYQLSEKLELSACVLSERFRKEIFIGLKGLSMASQLSILLYLVPTKDGEKKYYTLPYYPFIKAGNDLRDTVLSSFWKHNKTIPLSVQDKVRNTEQWFRFVKTKRPK